MMKPLHFFSSVMATLALAVIAATGASAQSAPTFTAVFSPAMVGPGGTSALTFTIDNTGSASPVENLAFDETLPAGLTIVGSGANSTCTGANLTAANGTTVISFADGGVGGSSSCTVSMDVSATATGAMTTGDLISDAGNSGPATATLTVDSDRPGFTKAFSPSTVDFGNTFTMTYTIDNTANGNPAVNPAFSETLPSGFTVASPAQASTTCGNTITAAAGGTSISLSGSSSVAAGTSCTAVVDVVAGVAGDATLTSGDLTSFILGVFGSSGPAAAQISVTVPADLSITKQFSDDPVAAGETVTLEYPMRNNDRSNAVTGLAFTDDMDAALSGLEATGLPLSTCGGTLSGTGLLSFSGGSLAAGASCTFEATLQIPGGATAGSYPSTSTTLTSDQGNGDTASDTLVVAAFEKLLFSKSFTDDPTQPGDSVTLEYTITNPNAGLAVTAIGFSDVLTDAISGATVTALPVAGSCGAGSVFFNVAIPPEIEMQMSGGDLAAGANCTVTMTLGVPGAAAPGSYPSTSGDLSYTVAATTGTTSGASDTLTVAGGADLTLIKEFSADQAVSGGTTDLTFTISSAAESASTATALAFTDDLDAFLTGTTLNSELTNTCGGTLSGSSSLSYSGGSIDPGNSCEISVRVNLGAGTGTQTNTTSTLTATAGGQATTAAAASDDIFLNTAEPVGLSIDFSPSEVVAGGTTVLTFSLDNPSRNPTDATAIAFDVNLDSALRDLASTSTFPISTCGGTLSDPFANGEALSFTGGALAAGASCDFSVDVLVPVSTADGSYTVLTSATSAMVDTNPVTGVVASDTLSVDGDVLTATKSFINDPVVVGDTVTLQFTIENTDEDDAVDSIAFTDDLDAMLSGAVMTAGTGSVCGGTLSGTDTIDLTGGSLAAGASCTFDVTVQVPGSASAGSYTNTTSGFTGLTNPAGLAVSGTAVSDTLQVVSVTPPSFALSIPSAPVSSNADLDLSFTITNNDSSSSLNDLEFSDDLDATLSGLTIVSGTGSDICGSGSSLSGTSFLTFTGGNLGPNENCSFTVTVQTPASPANGTYDVTTSALESNGLMLANAASDSFMVDATGPSVTLTSDVAHLGAGETATITFTFDDTPVGFDDSDITVTGGSLSSVVVNGGDPTIYTAVFTPTDGSTDAPSITVAAGSYTDTTGNAGAAGASPSITVDTESPAVSLSTGSTTLSGVFQVTATFAEEMVGFQIGDITVGNGGASTLASSDNIVFTFDVTPQGDGGVTIDIAAGVAQDLDGNDNLAANQLGITSDSTPPSVEITGPSDAVGGLFQATVTFSEDVIGFQQGDLTIAQGVISNFAGSGAVYTFDVTPEIGETVVIGLAAGVATDAAGNSNLAAADYSVGASSPAQEFEEHREEVRDIVKNEAYTRLNAQVAANTRMVQQARNRFILGKSQLDDPGGGYAARNNIGFDVDGSLGFIDGAFNTRGVFSQQRGNFEGSYRRILFGDFDLSRDENGTVSAYLSGKVAWERMINDRTMLGYNIGLDLGRSDIEGSFSGSQDTIGVSVGAYFVSQLAERLYADGFISLGAERNNLDLDNGTLALNSDYTSYTTTVGAALTGVYEMSGYELWPELSFTYGYTDIGVIGLTGTAFGLTDSSLTLDAGYVALGTLSFAPEFIIPMDGQSALESNRMLSFKPNVTCEMVKSGSSTSNCGGGVALGLYAVSRDGQALLDAKVRIDRIGDVTRTGLELSFDYTF